MMPYIQYLHPSEGRLYLPKDLSDSHGGKYYVPLKPDGKPYKTYYCDIRKYIGQGNWQNSETVVFKKESKDSNLYYTKVKGCGIYCVVKSYETPLLFNNRKYCPVIISFLDMFFEETGYIFVGMSED
jgi:hypothetical protein